MAALVCVLDTSVLVGGLRPGEPSYAASRALLEMLVQQRAALFLPSIALPEAAAAIVRGSGSDRQAREDVALILQLPGLVVVSVDVTLATQAADLAASQRIRGCDAVYVALARSLGAILITLDRQQRERTPSSVTAFAPAEALAELRRR